ncbi:sodium channel modifier 1 [Heptranchias perlo]|uniref:sodium channel modifier 1 n=1 Tax=Heptranchias perlo TaxID=212740 RepID=UPI00355959DD
MAFKREGDDLSQLNALKKRRVADLLASYIPEDEAILMKNGRYACSVCSYLPVFDTVDMLAVHRSGKKHVESLQRFYGHKQGLRLEIQKRRHQQYVREEESGAAGAKQTADELAPLLRQTRRIAHHALLKAAPYNSCCKRRRPGEDDLTISPYRSDTTGVSQQTPAGASRDVTEPPRVSGGPSSTDMVPTASLPAGDGTRTGSPGSHAGSARKKSRKKVSKSQKPPQSTPADAEKRKLMEHYLKLRSSGWIQDGRGRWVRDERVEFDSDEEEPPPLSLP